MEDNSNNGLLTKIWGPPAWTTLESFAFGYPINPKEEDKIRFREFYNSVKHVLPCKFCRDSYSQMIKEPDTDLDNALESRDSLTEWIYNIHTKVNKKLNVTYGITLEDFRKKYESFRAKCVKDKLATGCNMPASDRTFAYKMAYNKDYPVIDIEIAKKFIPYAKLRGFTEDDFSFINFYSNFCKKYKDIYDNNTCDVWIHRNKLCDHIIKKIRTGVYKTLEDEGSEWAGLPSIYEIKLILHMTTTLVYEDVEKIIDKLPKIRKSKYILVKVAN